MSVVVHFKTLNNKYADLCLCSSSINMFLCWRVRDRRLQQRVLHVNRLRALTEQAKYMLEWKNRKIIIYILPCECQSGMFNSSHLNSEML